MRRVGWLAFEVTLIWTTAGETFSKMSAKDIGAPGGGAKAGAPAMATRTGCGSAAPAVPMRMPTPARAAAATPAPATAPTMKPDFLAVILVFPHPHASRAVPCHLRT